MICYWGIEKTWIWRVFFLKLEAVTLLMDVIFVVQKGHFFGLFSCIGALSLPKP